MTVWALTSFGMLGVLPFRTFTKKQHRISSGQRFVGTGVARCHSMLTDADAFFPGRPFRSP